MRFRLLTIAVGLCELLLLAALCGLPRAAFAQPMMMNPAQMSGIPRPDPQVPVNTVTVRLIRGELQNRLVDTAVELVDLGAADKPPRIEKTDAEGRATFGGLEPASYQARATVSGQTLTSQPIAVQPAPEPGIRVMLVFPKTAADDQKELGSPDGKARVDNSAPVGTLLVKLVDGAGQPLAGLRTVLVHANRDSQKVEALPEQTSAADGSVHFSDLKTGPDVGYMLTAQREGSEQRSQPFHLDTAHGSVLAMTMRIISRDAGSLKLGKGSHIVFEPQDDTVQVIEYLSLSNSQPQPVDPGPAGVRIALAEDALSPQVLPGGPATLSVDATASGPPTLVFKGMVPPGETLLSVGFVIKQHGSLTFRQVASLPYEDLTVVAVKQAELQIDGVTNQREGKFNGRDLLVAQAVLPSRGGTIELTLTGLPTDFYWLRRFAAVAALAIALTFLRLIMKSGASESDTEAQRLRQELLDQREALLDELLRLEAEPGGEAATPGKSKRKRTPEVVRAELETLYRRLDEADG